MIMDQINNIFGRQPYLSCLYQAIFITAYYGLFRVSELTKTPSGHQVRAKDVHIGKNKKKLLFVLHTSTTHTKGMKPQLIKITSEKLTKQLDIQSNYERRMRYCPFEMVKNYIKVCKSQKFHDEQFFVFSDRTPVTDRHLHIVLHQAIKLIRLNPTLYSGHGLCAGRASELLDMGFSVETIKK